MRIVAELMGRLGRMGWLELVIIGTGIAAFAVFTLLIERAL